MYELMWLVIGWFIGLFTTRILEPISHWLGTAWHLVTRRKGGDSTEYDILKTWKIHRVRKFFRIPRPPSKN